MGAAASKQHGKQPDGVKTVSVVVPALNEEGRVGEAVHSALQGFPPPLEVIVVDGGSRDGTAAEARRAGAKVLTSARGRGVQLDAGAAAARGEVLLFLHADSLLPEGYGAELQRCVRGPGPRWGAFKTIAVQASAQSLGFQLLSCAVQFRTWAFRMPYGDQGIFVDQQLFRQVGGHRGLPLMEDVDLVVRLRRACPTMRLAQLPVTTNARRWCRMGLLRTTLLNQATFWSWMLGAEPAVLAKFYAAGTWDMQAVAQSAFRSWRW